MNAAILFFKSTVKGHLRQLKSSELDEDALEAAYWAFDTERKRDGMERDAFKGQMRKFARNTLKAQQHMDFKETAQ